MSDSIEVRPLGAGRFRVAGADGGRLAYAVAQGAQTWVFLDGRVYVIEDDEGPSRRRGRGHDAHTVLASPMPATVLSVSVAPGDQVARGDVLVMLEAMKMELPIAAPRDGTVKTVSCKAGDLVQPGLVLVELE